MNQKSICASWTREIPGNARFWIYLNGGPIKLTLKPGQTLRWCTSHPTDEGWHAEGGSWLHNHGRIRRSWWSEGRDCDGRLSHFGYDSAPLDKLAEEEPYIGDSRPEDWQGVVYPAWEHEESGQRDEYAEAAGY